MDVVHERTICFGDYVVRCIDLQDRELVIVDIGMKEDLRTIDPMDWVREGAAYLINGRFYLR